MMSILSRVIGNQMYGLEET